MEPLRPVVLVVDHRPAVADALAQSLKDESSDALDVVCASTPAEALALARRHAERLAGIVAEQELPSGATGLDVLATLRAEHPSAKRILLARDASRLVREREYGMLHAAVTPDNVGDIAAGLVQEVLESSRAQAIASHSFPPGPSFAA